MATTPAQTIGPFPHAAWQWAVEATAPKSASLQIEGRLLDGDGQAINDGWVEAWTPADPAAGALPGFTRLPTDGSGRFRLVLAARPAPGEPAACVIVFARGLLQHQFSAVFLAEDANSALLADLPAARRATLLARPLGPQHYGWDIRLQGDANEETVFFDPA